jgi:hypothetical protein
MNGIVTGICLLRAYNTSDNETEGGGWIDSTVPSVYCLNRLILIRLEDNF